MTFDFLFSRITNVNFGGDWVGIGVDRPSHLGVPQPTTVRIDFPDLAGGTPGLTVLPNSFPSYPYAVSNADLVRKVRTAAGRQFTTFGVTGINKMVVTLDLLNVSLEGYSRGTEIYFMMPTAAKFDMNISLVVEGALANPTIDGFIVPSAVMKAGLTLPAPPTRRTQGDLLDAGNSWVTRWSVDPAAKQITYLGT